jgi:hypothetical protein
MLGKIKMDMRAEPNPFFTWKVLAVSLIVFYLMYMNFWFLVVLLSKTGLFLLLVYLFSEKAILLYDTLKAISMMPP